MTVQNPPFLRRIHQETLDLMVEARYYLVNVAEKERTRAEMGTGLRMACESMRVTTRLTQVMAWVMAQRAVESGEMTTEEALAEPYRLSGETVCLDETFAEDEALSPSLRRLLDRSFRLYLRVARLEGQMVSALRH